MVNTDLSLETTWSPKHLLVATRVTPEHSQAGLGDPSTTVKKK